MKREKHIEKKNSKKMNKELKFKNEVRLAYSKQTSKY